MKSFTSRVPPPAAQIEHALRRRRQRRQIVQQRGWTLHVRPHVRTRAISTRWVVCCVGINELGRGGERRGERVRMRVRRNRTREYGALANAVQKTFDLCKFNAPLASRCCLTSRSRSKMRESSIASSSTSAASSAASWEAKKSRTAGRTSDDIGLLSSGEMASATSCTSAARCVAQRRRNIFSNILVVKICTEGKQEPLHRNYANNSCSNCCFSSADRF